MEGFFSAEISAEMWVVETILLSTAGIVYTMYLIKKMYINFAARV